MATFVNSVEDQQVSFGISDSQKTQKNMFDYFSGNMYYKVLIAMLVDLIGHTFLELISELKEST